MTGDPRHYVPVLKVKMGEKFALGALNLNLKPHVTPLLEIVERKLEKTTIAPTDHTPENGKRKPEKTIAKHLDTAFKLLSANLVDYPRCFIDTREIHSDGPTAVEDVFRRAVADGIPFVPVTGIERQVDVIATMANRANGIALRVPREVCLEGGFQSRFEDFMRTHSLAHQDVDVILDLGLLDNMVGEGVYRMTLEALNKIPNHNLWRTLTVIGCAFPEKLGAVPTNHSGELCRSEWLGWRDGVFSDRSSLVRVPSYGDCVIQHPGGVEDYNPVIMPMTPKIKYALSESWLVIRGGSHRKTPLVEQFPRLAAQLVTGSHQAQYMGPGHCHGCESIQASANGAKGMGSPEKWCRIGTVHHMTTVVESMRSLAWP